MSRPITLATLVIMVAAASVRADRGIASSVRSESVPAPVPQSGPALPYVDLDQWGEAGAADSARLVDEDWMWQLLPEGLIYESHLANTKESRMSVVFLKPQNENDWLMDGTVGGRVGMLRYGTNDPIRPQGFQLDVEGSAQLRLDPEENQDLRSVDFRCGVPLTYSAGRSQWRFGYYHISAHLGDEFLLKNPGFTRLNFSRDVLLLGYAFYFLPRVRVYSEAGWAFYSDISEQWEFQFGIDHAPDAPTGPQGAPFWAINGHLREEVDYGGSLTVQAGWAWRSDTGSPLLRAGLHYFNGKSNQYSFFNEHEEQLGMALWYDF